MIKEECEIETSKAIMGMRSRIAELEEKISILLSCKKCPENKGGWVCVKEYENKCLTQKIVYIKELKKESVEMNKQLIKAKELIKEILSILPKENIEGVYEITEEAEQFLKESE